MSLRIISQPQNVLIALWTKNLPCGFHSNIAIKTGAIQNQRCIFNSVEQLQWYEQIAQGSQTKNKRAI